MSLATFIDRHRNSFHQLFRFGLVGGVGVIVNQAVLIVCNVIARDFLHLRDRGVFLDPPFTDFNVRNYHVYVMIAFLAANLCNFLLNRYWTFKSENRAHFWHEYWPFLLVGFAAQLVGLVPLTLLMHPDSPIGLPSDVFDDSSGLRTKLYWANLLVIGFVTPINFVLNKLWTFRAVRQRYGRQNTSVSG
ncbi:MAG: GtrA family protein [Micropruina sp.]|nr:GtrA family protein [Micropruina sp.]